MVKFYIGSVVGITPSTGLITFNIPGFAEVAGTATAVPATKLSRQPTPNEEVFIIQPNSDLEIFYYLLMTQDSLGISIQNGVSYARLYNTGTIGINNGKCEIKLDSDSSIKINNTIGEISISETGAIIIKNNNYTFSLGSSGSASISNGSGGIVLNSDGSVVINSHLSVST